MDFAKTRLNSCSESNETTKASHKKHLSLEARHSKALECVRKIRLNLTPSIFIPKISQKPAKKFPWISTSIPAKSLQQIPLTKNVSDIKHINRHNRNKKDSDNAKNLKKRYRKSRRLKTKMSPLPRDYERRPMEQENLVNYDAIENTLKSMGLEVTNTEESEAGMIFDRSEDFSGNPSVKATKRQLSQDIISDESLEELDTKDSKNITIIKKCPEEEIKNLAENCKTKELELAIVQNPTTYFLKENNTNEEIHSNENIVQKCPEVEIKDRAEKCNAITNKGTNTKELELALADISTTALRQSPTSLEGNKVLETRHRSQGPLLSSILLDEMNTKNMVLSTGQCLVRSQSSATTGTMHSKDLSLIVGQTLTSLVQKQTLPKESNTNDFILNSRQTYTSLPSPPLKETATKDFFSDSIPTSIPQPSNPKNETTAKYFKTDSCQNLSSLVLLPTYLEATKTAEELKTKHLSPTSVHEVHTDITKHIKSYNESLQSVREFQSLLKEFQGHVTSNMDEKIYCNLRCLEETINDFSGFLQQTYENMDIFENEQRKLRNRAVCLQKTDIPTEIVVRIDVPEMPAQILKFRKTDDMENTTLESCHEICQNPGNKTRNTIQAQDKLLDDSQIPKISTNLTLQRPQRYDLAEVRSSNIYNPYHQFRLPPPEANVPNENYLVPPSCQHVSQNGENINTNIHSPERNKNHSAGQISKDLASQLQVDKYLGKVKTPPTHPTCRLLPVTRTLKANRQELTVPESFWPKTTNFHAGYPSGSLRNTSYTQYSPISVHHPLDLNNVEKYKMYANSEYSPYINQNVHLVANSVPQTTASIQYSPAPAGRDQTLHITANVQYTPVPAQQFQMPNYPAFRSETSSVQNAPTPAINTESQSTSTEM